MLLRERIAHLFSRSGKEPFYALRDASFTVATGESMALIGHNGAGKSTVLCLAVGLAAPNSGTVDVRGRVAALLELGSGFHPDLTGRENICVNGALLGLSRQEVRRRMDTIIEFAELGDFIEEPLRTYSTGMVMRLAFAVAVNVNPDVLLIDEVLGVGDQAFFAKCVDKIMEFRHRGKTLLCVSHSPKTLRELCDRAIWLDHGRIVRQGPVGKVLDDYEASISACAATKQS
jgi:ABC-type polysaccharide/polyol phosphate transport system ATPase subunit